MEFKHLDSVNIFVPEKNELIIISEGSGDNLSYADRAEGYIDYIYFSQYSLDDGSCEEIDGGIVMTKKFLVDLYKSLADKEAIEEVLFMAYDKLPDYILLENKKGILNYESKDYVGSGVE